MLRLKCIFNTPVKATCCGHTLSEWFVDPLGGMRCLFCQRVYPFFTHEEFRSTREARA